jgi:hypothetical protein
MLYKNKQGEEIELELYGKYDDDIQVSNAYYADKEGEVSDDEIEYIMEYYSSEIYEQWYQNKVGESE